MKTIERIKTILIIVLIICAVYQISISWFDTSNYSNVISNQISKELLNENEYYYKPNNVVISFGNGTYTIVKQTRLEISLINSYVSKIYSNIFEDRDVREANISLEELYDTRCIILEYANNYDEEEFRKIFNINSEKIARTINSISKLFICPIIDDENKIEIYLQNMEGKFFYFELSIDSTELYGLIDEINMFNQVDIYTLSTNEENYDLYEEIVLLPSQINDYSSFATRKPTIVNPLVDEEKKEEYANAFFENPKAKWKMQKDEDIIIYGDGSKSIRIYNSGYIEYTANINNAENYTQNITFDESIKNVTKFLENDIYLSNELYIESIDIIDDNSYKIGYNYRINGIDQLFSNRMKDIYSLSSPIEIIITNGEVEKYKRIVQNIEFEQNLEQFEIVNYSEVIDAVSDTLNEKGNIKINDVQILYRLDEEAISPDLVWYVKFTNGEIYICDFLRGAK